MRPPRYVGKTVIVRSSFGGYTLPAGLPENSAVRIVGQSPGYFAVERDGQRFTVAMPCVKFIDVIGR